MTKYVVSVHALAPPHSWRHNGSSTRQLSVGCPHATSPAVPLSDGSCTTTFTSQQPLNDAVHVQLMLVGCGRHPLLQLTSFGCLPPPPSAQIVRSRTSNALESLAASTLSIAFRTVTALVRDRDCGTSSTASRQGGIPHYVAIVTLRNAITIPQRTCDGHTIY